MSKVVIELDKSGILQLLSSPEMQNCVNGIANGCVNSLSGNYSVQSKVSKGRAVSNIKTADKKTYYNNLKTNELLKATSPNNPH